MHNPHADSNKRGSGQYYDLTEEASKRPEGEEATTALRMAENDDVNEENGAGPVNRPDDTFVDNKVPTLDDR
jgi:hypothetical protein